MATIYLTQNKKIEKIITFNHIFLLIDETSTNKATNNEQTTETTTSKSSKSHKGLIGKFQNLFKSSNPSLGGHKDGSKKHEKLEKQERQQQQEKPAETTNEADLVAKSVEIVNYQKKTLDTFNNDTIK